MMKIVRSVKQMLQTKPVSEPLMNELAKGRKSGEEKGWLSSDDVRAHFRAEKLEV